MELHRRQCCSQAKAGLLESMIIHNSFRLRRITTWMRLEKPAFRVSRIWNNVQPLVRSSEVWGTPVNQEWCELDFDAVHGIMEKECGQYARRTWSWAHIELYVLTDKLSPSSTVNSHKYWKQMLSDWLSTKHRSRLQVVQAKSCQVMSKISLSSK